MSSFVPHADLRQFRFWLLCALTTISGLSWAYQDDPAFHWTLDEGTGVVAGDSGVGQGSGPVPGQIEGAVWTQGVSGFALAFDGVDDRVSLNGPGLSGETLSFALWMKADDFERDDARLLSRAQSTNASDHDWMISTDGVNGAFHPRVRFRTNGNTVEFRGDQPLEVDVWTHLAVVYDGARIVLFQDGVEVGSRTKTGAVDERAGLGVAIGNQPDGAGSRAFDGTIDDVRIYDRALTPAEVALLADPCNGLPVAVMGLAASGVIAPVGVDFDAAGSDDCDGKITAIDWDFGDGSSGSGPLVNHTYTSAGVYTATLTVTDDSGNTAQVSRTIQVYASDARVNANLLAEYRFTEGSGAVVFDVSGVVPALDLTIDDPAGASWVPCGGLTLTGGAMLSSGVAADKLNAAIRTSGAIAIEAWIAPANTTQDGPARIATLSANTGNRNVTLGQEAAEYVTRLRTSTAGNNGSNKVTQTSGNAVATELQHVVYTRDASGQAFLYVDGQLMASETIDGDLEDWADGYAFGLGNEFGGGRPWLGTYHLIAVYDGAMTPDVVTQHAALGIPTVCNREPIARLEVDRTSGQAPLIVNFDAGNSTDYDGSIASVAWDFGDGVTGSGATAAHTYGAAGSYVAQVTVTDDGGATATRAIRIVVTEAGMATRADSGLLALYRFDETAGDVLLDQSGVGVPLDLSIDDPANTQWLACGGLSFDTGTTARADGRAQKLITALTASNAITLETWVHPENLTQGPSSPARMLSLSGSTGTRNATLGQKASEYSTRLRTTETSNNGQPATITNGSAATLALTHVVYTRDAAGTARLYVNGQLRGEETIGGDFSNWDPEYGFTLANESSGDRPWLGGMHLAAVYARALSSAEVGQNYSAGLSEFCLELTLDAPVEGLLTNGDAITVNGTVSYPNAPVIVNGLPAAVNGTNWSLDLPLADEGPIAINASVSLAGKTATATRTIVRDLTPPAITLNAPDAVFQDSDLLFDWNVIDTNGLASVSVARDGLEVSTDAGGSFVYSVPVDANLTEIILRVNAVDAVGNSAIQTRTVLVYPPCTGAPTAEFSATPNGFTTPVSVSFDGSASRDCDGTITSYAWDFGDGNSASGAQVTHQFAELGSYAVTLTVTDDSGQTASVTQNLVLRDPHLLAEYVFADLTGSAVVPDISGIAPALDLTIQDPANTVWEDCGGLTVDTATLIRSEGPASKIIDAVKASGAFTLEAWITPANLDQSGPARIVTLSEGSSNRNVTLGQATGSYVTRFRTSTTGNNGLNPVTQSDNSAVRTTSPSHVVYTRDAAGNAVIYVDGAVAATETVGGDLSAWNDTYALGLAGEIGANRAWLGTYYQVALYDAALSPERVNERFNAGLPTGIDLPDSCNRPPVARIDADRLSGEAPLLAALDGSASFDQDGTVVSYAWDFGDGRTATGATVNHTFLNPGRYTVRLTVTDDQGETGTRALEMTVVAPGSPYRVEDGLTMLYAFREGSGNKIYDQAADGGDPLDLTIGDVSRVTWNECGGLTIIDDTIALSEMAPADFIQNAQASNSLTIEAWVKPANLTQGPSSPARIATLSDTPTNRNVTLGQKAGEFSTRLRTTTNSNNGNSPATITSGGSVATELQHVVFVREADGRARIFVNNQVMADQTIDGDLSNWDANYLFALGNEINPMERSFLGDMYLVAAYGRALTDAEVERNYQAGVAELCPNNPPFFTSTPVVQATALLAYSYDADAEDADNDPLTYALDQAPAGMTIEAASALVNWTPRVDQVGTHLVELSVNDGNDGWAVQAFTVEVINPELSVAIDVPADGLLTNADSVTVSGTVSDGAASVTVNGLAAPLSGQNWTVDVPLTVEGEILLEALATLSTLSASDNRTIVRDVTPPVIALSAPGSVQLLQTFDYDWNVTDDRELADVSVTRDGLAVSSEASGVASFAVPDDPTLTGIVLAVTATDAAGNSASETRTVAVAAPTLQVSFTAPAAGLLTNADTVTVTGTFFPSDGIVTLNGLATTQTDDTWTIDLPLTAEGEIALTAVVTRASQSANAMRTVIRDVTPPVIALSAPGSAQLLQTFDYNWNVTDDRELADVSVTRDGAAVSSDANGTASYAVPDDPTLTGIVIAVAATDAAGNSASEMRTVTVGAPTLQVAFTAPDAGFLTNADTVTVTGTFFPSDGTVTLNGLATTQTDDTWTIDLPLTTEGEIALNAVVTVNSQSESAARTIIRDVTPPVIALNAPVEVRRLADLIYDWSVTDERELATVGVLRDGTSVSIEASGSETFSVPNDAGLTAIALQVNATDTAGNSASQTVGVNVLPPVLQIVITAPVAGFLTNADTITVTGTYFPSDATVTVNGLATSQTADTWTVELPLTADGEVLIQAIASLGGDSASADVKIYRDATPPAVTAVAPETVIAGQNFDLTWTINDLNPIDEVVISRDGTPVQTYPDNTITSLNLTTELGDSGKTIALIVSGRDTAGNIGQAAVSVLVIESGIALTVTEPADNSQFNTVEVRVAGTVSPVDASLTVDGESVGVDGTGAFESTRTLADGTHVITVGATRDPLTPVTATRTVLVDTTPPVVTITAPAQLIRGETVTVTVDAQDQTPITNLTFSAGAQSFPATSGSSATFQVVIGENEPATELILSATATDSLANQGSASVTVPIVDVSSLPAVEITITSHEHRALTEIEEQTIAGVVDPADARVTLEGQPVTTDENGLFSFPTTLRDGVNTFLFNGQRDGYLPGNAKLDLFLDGAIPVITFITPDQDFYTNQPTVTISGAVTDLYDPNPTLTRGGTPVSMTGDRFVDPDVPLQPGENQIGYEATDSLGNTGTNALRVFYNDQAPTVELIHPEAILAGAAYQVTVNAAPGATLSTLRLLRDGEEVGATTVTNMLTVDLTHAGEGQMISLLAIAVDRHGNRAEAVGQIAIASPSYVHGKAVADATSYLLPGVELAVTTPLGTTPLMTDENGFFETYVYGYPVEVTVTDARFASIARHMAGVRESWRVTDLRLVTRGPAQAATSASFNAGDQTIQLDGNFGGSASVTAYNSQTIPELLPLGYSPVRGFDLEGATGAGALAWTSSDARLLPLGARLLVLKRSGRAWRVVQTQLTASETLNVTIPEASAGEYLVAIADDWSGVTLVNPGDLIERRTEARVPPSVLADSNSIPAKVSVYDDPMTRIQLRLQTSGSLLAGSQAQVLAREFHMRFAENLTVQPYPLDIYMYSYNFGTQSQPSYLGGGLDVRTRAEVSPDITRMAEVIFAGKPGPGDLARIGGTRVWNLGGVNIDLSDAADGPRAADLQGNQPAELTGLRQGEILGGFTMEVGGELDRSANLSLAATDHQSVVLLHSPDNGNRWYFAGQLVLQDGAWINDPATTDARRGGAYTLVGLNYAITEISGRVLDGGVPVSGALVSVSAHGFFSTTASDGTYRLFVPRGPTGQTVNASQPIVRLAGSLSLPATLGQASLSGQDINVTQNTFRLVESQPVNESRNLGTLPEFVLTFDEPVSTDAALLQSQITLADENGTAENLQLQVDPGRLVVRALPAMSLEYDLGYTLTVGGGLTSLYGDPLDRTYSIGIRTRSAEPARNLDLTRFMLTVDGEQLYLEADPDAFAPGTRLQITNADLGFFVALDLLDQPLRYAVAGALGDPIYLEAVTPDGETVSRTIDLVMTAPNTFMIGSEPFTLELQEGLLLAVDQIEAGVGSEVKISVATPEEAEAQLMAAPFIQANPALADEIQILNPVKIEPVDPTQPYGFSGNLIVTFQKDQFTEDATISTVSSNTQRLPLSPDDLETLEEFSVVSHQDSFQYTVDNGFQTKATVGGKNPSKAHLRTDGLFEATVAIPYQAIGIASAIFNPLDFFLGEYLTFMFQMIAPKRFQPHFLLVHAARKNTEFIDPPPVESDDWHSVIGDAHPVPNAYVFHTVPTENAYRNMPLGKTDASGDVGTFVYGPPGTVSVIDPLTGQIGIDVTPLQANTADPITGVTFFQFFDYLVTLDTGFFYVNEGIPPRVKMRVDVGDASIGSFSLDSDLTQDLNSDGTIDVVSDVGLRIVVNSTSPIAEEPAPEFTITGGIPPSSVTLSGSDVTFTVPNGIFSNAGVVNVRVRVYDENGNQATIEDSFLVIDGEPQPSLAGVTPFVLGVSPANDAENIGISEPIVVTFSEGVRGINNTSIKLTEYVNGNATGDIPLSFVDQAGVAITDNAQTASRVRLIPNEALQLSYLSNGTNASVAYLVTVDGVLDDDGPMQEPYFSQFSMAPFIELPGNLGNVTEGRPPFTRIAEKQNLAMVLLGGPMGIDGYSSFRLKLFDIRNPIATDAVWENSVLYHNLFRAEFQIFTPDDIENGDQAVYGPDPTQPPLDDLPVGTLIPMLVSWDLSNETNEMLLFEYREGAAGNRFLKRIATLPVGSLGWPYSSAQVGKYFLVGMVDISGSVEDRILVYDVERLKNEYQVLEQARIEGSISAAQHFIELTAAGQIASFPLPGDVTQITPFLRQKMEDGFRVIEPTLLASGFNRPAAYGFDLSQQPPIIGLTGDSPDPDYDGREIAKFAYSSPVLRTTIKGNAAAERFSYRDPATGQQYVADMAMFSSSLAGGRGEIRVFRIPSENTNLAGPAESPVRILEFESGVRSLAYDESSGLLALATYSGEFGVIDLKTLLEIPTDQGGVIDSRGYEHPAFIAPATPGSVRSVHFIEGNLFTITHGGDVRRYPVAPLDYRERGWMYYDLNAWMLDDESADIDRLTLADDMAFFATDLAEQGSSKFVMELGTYAIDLLDNETITMKLIDLTSGAELLDIERENGFGTKREYFSLNALNGFFDAQANQAMLREKGYLPFRFSYAITKNGLIVAQDDVNFPVFYQSQPTEGIDQYRAQANLDFLTQMPHWIESDQNSADADPRLSQSFGRVYRADSAFQPGLYGVGMLSTQQLHMSMPAYWDVSQVPADSHNGDAAKLSITLEQPGQFILNAEANSNLESVRFNNELNSEFKIASGSWTLTHDRSMEYVLRTNEPLPDFKELFNNLNNTIEEPDELIYPVLRHRGRAPGQMPGLHSPALVKVQKDARFGNELRLQTHSGQSSIQPNRVREFVNDLGGQRDATLEYAVTDRWTSVQKHQSVEGMYAGYVYDSDGYLVQVQYQAPPEVRVRNFTWEPLPDNIQGSRFVYKRLKSVEQGVFSVTYEYDSPSDLRASGVVTGFGSKTLTVNTDASSGLPTSVRLAGVGGAEDYTVQFVEVDGMLLSSAEGFDAPLYDLTWDRRTNGASQSWLLTASDFLQTSFTYDNRGRQTSVSRLNGSESWSYNADTGPFSSWPSSYTDPVGRSYQVQADESGVRMSLGGLSHKDLFSTSGVPLGETNIAGLTSGGSQSRHYGPVGNSWQSLNGRVTKVPYDGVSFIEQEFTYNGFGEPQKSVIEGVSFEILGRDGSGQATSVLERGGLTRQISYAFEDGKYVITRAYDGLSTGRVTKYDEKFRLVEMTDVRDGFSENYQFTYDRLDRPTGVTQNGIELWQSTFRGDTTSVSTYTAPELQLTFNYSSDNFQPVLQSVTAVDQATGDIKEIVFEDDPLGRTIRDERDGIGVVRYEYDDFDRLVRMVADECNTPIHEYVYSGAKTTRKDLVWGLEESITLEDAAGFNRQVAVKAPYRPTANFQMRTTVTANNGNGYLFEVERTGSGFPLSQIFDQQGEKIGVEVDGHAVKPTQFDAWGNPTQLSGLSEAVNFNYTPDGTFAGASGFGTDLQMTIRERRIESGSNARGQAFQIDYDAAKSRRLSKVTMQGVDVYSRSVNKTSAGKMGSETITYLANPDRGFAKKLTDTGFGDQSGKETDRTGGTPVTEQVTRDPKSGLVTAAVDEQGDSYALPRDCFGRLAGDVTLDGQTYTVTWEDSTNRACYTPANPEFESFCIVYDGYGQPHAFEGAQYTVVSRDELGRVVSIEADGEITTIQYDGPRLVKVQGNTNIDFSDFNETGEPGKAELSGLTEATVLFDDWSPFAGAREVTIEEGASSTKLMLDDLGFFRALQDTDGAMLEVNRTPWGNIESFVIDGQTQNGDPSSGVYDIGGGQTMTLDPEGRLAAMGRLAPVNGGVAQLVNEQFVYGPDGRLVEKRIDGQTVATYTNEEGLFSVFYPDEDRAVDFGFAKNGALLGTTETRDLSTTPVVTDMAKLERDPVAPERITAYTDANGVRAEYTYSASGDVVGIDIENGPTFSFGHDALGRITRVEAGGMSTDYQGYIGNIPSTIVWGNGEMFLATVDQGRLISLQSADFNLDLTWFTGYDTDGDDEIDDFRPPSITQLIRSGPGFSETWDIVSGEFDRRLQSVVITRSSGQEIEETYGYTSNGLINGLSRRLDGTQTLDLTYDLAGLRVAEESSNGTPVRTARYDRDGNLTQVQDENLGAVIRGFEYNPERLMTSLDINDPSAGVTERLGYSYDTRGLRYETVNQLTLAKTVYFYHEGQVIAIGTKLGSVITWTHAVGRAGLGVAFIKDLTGAGGDYYVFNDHVGTPFAYRNANTDAVTYTPFSPWGELLAQLPSRGPPYAEGNVPSGGIPVQSNPRFGLSGHIYDVETGLTYMGARYYDARYGHFLTRDLRLPEVGDPSSVTQPYAYARGNPVLFVDEDGLKPRGPGRGRGLSNGPNVTRNLTNSAAGTPNFGDIPGGSRVSNSVSSPNDFRLDPGSASARQDISDNILPNTRNGQAQAIDVQTNGGRVELDTSRVGGREPGAEPSRGELFDRYGEQGARHANGRNPAEVDAIINGEISASNQRTDLTTANARNPDVQVGRDSRPEIELQARNTAGCFIEGTLVRTPAGFVPIESLRVGQRVSAPQSGDPDISDDRTQTWYRVAVDLRLTDTHETVALTMLRPAAWIARTDAALGALIHIQLAEIGIQGWGRVVAFERTQTPVVGDGEVVLAAMTRIAKRVVELNLTDGQSVTATLNHPLYSLDRNAWVEAGDLKRGETLSSLNGPVQLRSKRIRQGPKRVFNIQVDKAQQYYVGANGLLCHNTCPTDGSGAVPGDRGGDIVPYDRDAGLRGTEVTIEFPVKQKTWNRWSKHKQQTFIDHLKEQEEVLNWMSLHRKEDLEFNLLYYDLMKKNINEGRKLGAEQFNLKGTGQHAAHGLDSIAGGFSYFILGGRNSSQSTIGSLWRTRKRQIVPGAIHRLIPTVR